MPLCIEPDIIAFKAYEPVSIQSSAVESVDESKTAASGLRSSTALKISLSPDREIFFFTHKPIV